MAGHPWDCGDDALELTGPTKSAVGVPGGARPSGRAGDGPGPGALCLSVVLPAGAPKPWSFQIPGGWALSQPFLTFQET